MYSAKEYHLNLEAGIEDKSAFRRDNEFYTHLREYLYIYRFSSFRASLANLAHNSACNSNSVSSFSLAVHVRRVSKHFLIKSYV